MVDVDSTCTATATVLLVWRGFRDEPYSMLLNSLLTAMIMVQSSNFDPYRYKVQLRGAVPSQYDTLYIQGDTCIY